MQKLKEKILKGLAWRSLADASQLILQIIFTAILARLLTRSDFGLVAMALIVNRFAIQMTQLGYGTAIIQAPSITNAQVSAIFIIHTITNLVVTIIAHLCIPLAVSFFDQPDLKPVLQVLIWQIFISSFRFPNILLQKRMNFKGYSLLQVSGMIISNIIGIGMALTGYGVWSLVVRLMFGKIYFAVLVWPLSKWRPEKPDFKGIGQYIQFGFNMLGSKICRYFSQNLASIIIGKFFGVETLGSFNIAYNLAINPAQKIQSVLTAVLTPAFSAIQTDRQDFRNKFQLSLFALGVVFIPAMLGLSAVAPNFVIVVYGEKWKEAGLFLTILAAVGLFKGLEQMLRSVIIARGWSASIFKITVAEVLISIPLLFIGSYYFGIIGLIISYLTASIASLMMHADSAQRASQGKHIFVKALWRSFAASIVMFLAVKSHAYIYDWNSVVSLASQIILGMGIYTIFRLIILNKNEKQLIDSLFLSRFKKTKRR